MKSELEKVKEEFASRLNLAMDEQGYPVRGRARVLSKEFGVSDKGAGKWINGEAIPETSKIPLIAAFLGINAEWLLSGVGEMRPTQSQRMGDMVQSQGEGWQGQRRVNFLRESGASEKAEISPALVEFIEALYKLNQEQKLDTDTVKHLHATLVFALNNKNI